MRAIPSILMSASWAKGLGKGIGMLQQGVESALGKLALEGPPAASAQQQRAAPAANLAEGFAAGFGSLSKGILKGEFRAPRSEGHLHRCHVDTPRVRAAGVTGLVTKPIEGAKQEGVAGAFKGAFKGVLGAAVNPVSGMVQGIAKTAEGALTEVQNRTKQIATAAEISRQLISGGPSGSEAGRVGPDGKLLRRRRPRPFGGDLVLKSYDEDDARGQERMWQALLARNQALGWSLEESMSTVQRLTETERYEWVHQIDQVRVFRVLGPYSASVLPTARVPSASSRRGGSSRPPTVSSPSRRCGTAASSSNGTSSGPICSASRQPGPR